MRTFQTQLEAVRNGNDTAQAQILGEFFYYLRSQVTRRVWNSADAEDAVSEFCIQALDKNLVRKFNGSNVISFKAYITMCLINFLRSSYKEREGVRSRERSVDPQAMEILDDSLTPDLEYERGTNLDSLRFAIDRLPEDYRNIIYLELRGWTQRQIATFLEKPNGTVAKYSQRAKENLRHELISAGFCGVFDAFGGSVTTKVLSVPNWI